MLPRHTHAISMLLLGSQTWVPIARTNPRNDSHSAEHSDMSRQQAESYSADQQHQPSSQNEQVGTATSEMFRRSLQSRGPSGNQAVKAPRRALASLAACILLTCGTQTGAFGASVIRVNSADRACWMLQETQSANHVVVATIQTVIPEPGGRWRNATCSVSSYIKGSPFENDTFVIKLPYSNHPALLETSEGRSYVWMLRSCDGELRELDPTLRADVTTEEAHIYNPEGTVDRSSLLDSLATFSESPTLRELASNATHVLRGQVLDTAITPTSNLRRARGSFRVYISDVVRAATAMSSSDTVSVALPEFTTKFCGHDVNTRIVRGMTVYVFVTKDAGEDTLLTLSPGAYSIWDVHGANVRVLAADWCNGEERVVRTMSEVTFLEQLEQ